MNVFRIIKFIIPILFKRKITLDDIKELIFGKEEKPKENNQTSLVKVGEELAFIIYQIHELNYPIEHLKRRVEVLKTQIDSLKQSVENLKTE